MIYFMDFYLSLDSKSQKKVEFVLDIIKKVQNVPAKFFKSIESSEKGNNVGGES